MTSLRSYLISSRFLLCPTAPLSRSPTALCRRPLRPDAGEIQLPDPPDHVVEGLRGVAGAVPQDLLAVLERQLVGGVAQGAVPRHGGGGHGEAHVLGPVDELEDGRLALVVPRLGLRPQHPRVPARPRQVALAQLAEELGEEVVGGLCVRVCSWSALLLLLLLLLLLAFLCHALLLPCFLRSGV